MTIATGLAQKLTLGTASTTRIVCNAVLMHLISEDEVKLALQEMFRIAKPGATIWVGEVPEIDEYAHFGQYRGTSTIGFLWYLLRNNGLRAFLGTCRRLLLASVGKEQIVLNSAGTYCAKPEELIALAQGAGWRLRRYFKHKDLDDNGCIVDAKFRYD